MNLICGRFLMENPKISIIVPVYHFLKFFFLKLKYFLFCFKYQAKFEDIFSDSEKYVLFLTHNYGGGTSLFENNLIAESKDKIIILRMISYRKNICVKIEKDGRVFYFPEKKLDFIFKKKFKTLIINSLLSFYNNEKFIPFLANYKKKNQCINFIVMIHDYYSVCPRFNLIANNWDCRLECEKHKCRFYYFAEKFMGNVFQWRNLWIELLSISDEIRCFSKSSKEIIKKAYPSLLDEKITVVPHNMDYCKFKPIENIEKLPFHLGIVGNVSTISKGKLIVQELLQRIPDSIPISIIGVTRKQIGNINRKNTHYLGKYKHADLQRIVEDETISMEIFPSIWSETFSYLVSEHIAMTVPVICFNMGAQAEKVRAYGKGIVVNDVDEMVKVILDKYEELNHDI